MEKVIKAVSMYPLHQVYSLLGREEKIGQDNLFSEISQILTTHNLLSEKEIEEVGINKIYEVLFWQEFYHDALNVLSEVYGYAAKRGDLLDIRHSFNDTSLDISLTTINGTSAELTFSGKTRTVLIGEVEVEFDMLEIKKAIKKELI